MTKSPYLGGAILRKANLREACLKRADLKEVDLTGTNRTSARRHGSQESPDLDVSVTDEELAPIHERYDAATGFIDGTEPQSLMAAAHSAGGGSDGLAARWSALLGPYRCAGARPSDRLHLDEMLVRIAAQRIYLWRAVDNEGEVLDTLVQRPARRLAGATADAQAAKKQGFAPKLLVTDKLALLRLRVPTSATDLSP